MPACLAAFVAVLLAPVAVLAQLPTIPQILAAEGSSKRIGGIPSGQPPGIDELLRDTDLVVRGTLGTPRPFLSDDELNVYTEYPLSDIEKLFERKLARPGVLPSPTVVVLGGTITIDGRTFEQIEHAFPPLPPGTQGVFLLTRRGDRYEVAGHGLGAFAVTSQGLRPFTRKQGVASELAALPVAEAQAQLAARARAIRR